MGLLLILIELSCKLQFVVNKYVYSFLHLNDIVCDWDKFKADANFRLFHCFVLNILNVYSIIIYFL